MHEEVQRGGQDEIETRAETCPRESYLRPNSDTMLERIEDFNLKRISYSRKREKKLTPAWTCLPSSRNFGISPARKNNGPPILPSRWRARSSLPGRIRKRTRGRANRWALPEKGITGQVRRVTQDDMARDFETCLAVAQATMLPRDVTKLQKEDELMTCSLTHEKKMLRRTEEGLEAAAALEGEVKRKGEELAVAAEELSKRQREVADLRQVAQGGRALSTSGLASMSEEARHSPGSPSVGDSEATSGLPRPEPYTPNFLSGFDKEEYFSQLTEGEENILEGVTEDEAEGDR
ncbi:hypothetical protein Acr_15g0010730 [Actinidia rufa]|uniref:Uncharacterized protein n=1 Tax=Actinidia rufa TaxID=165716 RepID=A0A7J0FUT4_9ERIC|nr:hypothetical protein Acr_15g0010730 [Actinidia rufa]